MYDYLIVGAGLFGSVFAHEMTSAGKKCIVIDRRCHIGGNCYTKKIAGINVHMYGAHIFHTSVERVWKYINKFAEFNRFTNSPIAVYGEEIYNLPFNMNTFNRIWGVHTPNEAKRIIAMQTGRSGVIKPSNLEEQAIMLVGNDIYEKLIKEYTEKQWGRPCSSLPTDIIKRIPLRYTFDNNYYPDAYQGIPIGGYTSIFEKLLDGCEVILNTDYSEIKAEINAKKTVYCGPVDEYYDYCLGRLEFRTLRFDTKIINSANYQGNAVVNYTSSKVPYTRVIEHKHFEFGQQPQTVVTWEYPDTYDDSKEPYYPINDQVNNELYNKYMTLCNDEVIFGGRLGKYRYYDMDQVILSALELSDSQLHRK